MDQTEQQPESPLMPPPEGAPPEGALPRPEGVTSAEAVPPPPVSFGRQMAQLVIIPALIVIICVGLSVMFGLIAGADSNIDAYLAKLKHSGGRGRIAFDLQDPRYKDRSLAAYTVATMIPKISDPVERKRVSDELIGILNQNVAEEENILRVYLLLAIGQLGQEGGLSVLTAHVSDPDAQVRQGAVGGLMNWPDRQGARPAIASLIKALQDRDAVVVMEAAAALGAIAKPGDEIVVKALHNALEQSGPDMREARWNSAVALARLGDATGSGIVAGLLLNRAELAKLPAGTGADARRTLDVGMQDRVILSTLSAAAEMTDPVVWGKIEDLSRQDPNGRIQSAARQLLLERNRQQAR